MALNGVYANIFILQNIRGVILINIEKCINLLKDELNKKGELQLTVYGDSMLPILKDGDTVKVQKCNEYKIGDIVAYFIIVDNKLKIVIHRIVLKRKEYLLTKGDNNNFIDNIKVRNCFVLGVVLF